MPDFVNQVIEGDCLAVLRELPDSSFHAVVTDPPYGLGKEPTVEQLVAFLQGADLITGDFMGAKWDIPSVLVWREVYRVLKPGGHVLAFGGTRTWDLMSLGARAAGFEFRDTIADAHPALMMVHGMGFPKSLNVSKGIDKAAGADREVVGTYRVGGNALTPTSEKGGTYVTGAPNSPPGDLEITKPATPEAEEWDGWGTALKPSWEPILVFRKPLEGTVIENVLAHGTGALNIDGTRVKTTDDLNGGAYTEGGNKALGVMNDDGWKPKDLGGQYQQPSGRWPPNMTLSHAPGCKRVGTKKVPVGKEGAGKLWSHYRDDTEDRATPKKSTIAGEDGLETVEVWECVEGCPVKALDEQSGTLKSGDVAKHHMRQCSKQVGEGGFNGKFGDIPLTGYGDEGGASRFFPQFDPFYYTSKANKREATLDGQIENNHPTKKPLGLMQWLVRLVCPKEGIVLDPYCGSGTTLHAAALEGMRWTGIERDPQWVETTQDRMKVVMEEVEAEQGQRDIFDFMMGGDDEG